ncbi:LAMI_0A05732g1_1 [Lachancea mirantina]|uniref:LAMI_0A05732g1_1 n=1 Tax=Lachancea mirantina TaxID=1230905 RepID=A0A1G4IPY7_9SACH|nr:LAMI_0A05732g1_1 [Lachancea mirantina]
MSRYIYAKLQPESTRKLLLLTPDILEAIKSGQKIEFKALQETQQVVLCSEEKTWSLRQKNHSNTVFLTREFLPDADEEGPELNDAVSHHLGFSRQSFELEPKISAGEINVNHLPIYDGENRDLVKSSTVEKLMESSPCSMKEFQTKWYAAGGCTINGAACLLTHGFLSRALHLTIMSCMAESIDLDDLNVRETFEAVSKDISEAGEFNPYTQEVIETVIGKFCQQAPDGKRSLDRKSVSKWYGITALKKFAAKQPLSHEEFMIKWKSQFPPYFNCNLDISLLQGHFFRPLASSIHYLSRSTLPDDVKDRFKYLFKIQSVWDLEDIQPLIEDLNTSGLKIDSFVMKFARRKRQGKRTIVTSR